MPCCVAYGCGIKKTNKEADPPITLHYFPQNEIDRSKWIKAVRRENWSPNKNSRICSKHFKKEDFDRTSPFVVKLREGVVPSVFETYPEHLKPTVIKERRVIVKIESTPIKSNRSPDKKQLITMLQTANTSLSALHCQLETVTSKLESTQNKLNSTTIQLNQNKRKLKNLTRVTNRLNKRNCVLTDIIAELRKEKATDEINKSKNGKDV